MLPLLLWNEQINAVFFQEDFLTLFYVYCFAYIILKYAKLFANLKVYAFKSGILSLQHLLRVVETSA